MNEDNDDIFALIVLQNSGFTTNDKIIEDDIAFILNRQKENGSWDNSVDMTGAGIEALTFSNRNEKVANALQKAKDFLKQKQKDNGGWGNASSTAWAMEGIVSFNEKFENWVKNGNTPLDYLAVNQDVDGGIKGDNMQNRIWETSYVLSVLSGKNWNQIMQKFEKIQAPEIVEVSKEVIKKQEIKKNETKKIIAKKTVNSNFNRASVITAVNNLPQKEKTETPVEKKSWFKRFFGRIFGF